MLRLLLVFLVSLVVAGGFFYRALMPPAPLALPEQGALLRNVTVIQPGEGRVPNQRIAIEGGRIVSLERSTGAVINDPYDAAYVLPGLIDMHVHFPPDTGLRQVEIAAFLFLYHGVTTVRDAGDTDGTSSTPVREGVASGAYPGPRSFACGPFFDGPEPIWPNSRVVTTPEEATAAVVEVAAAGWDCIKVYDRLAPEVLEAIQAAANRHGLPVIGHVPRAVPFEEARLDDVQHMTGVQDVAGSMEPYPEILAAWEDFDEERAARIEAAALEHDIAFTPTLVTTERGIAYDDYEALRAGPDASLLPRFYADVVWSPTEGLPFLRERTPAGTALMRAAYPKVASFVGRLVQAGATVHAGTDTQIAFIVPGIALHREIRLLAEDAGLGPEAALAAATTVPGESLPVAQLGRIEPGAPADLVVFRRDPTFDLAGLDDILAVVADGRLYTRAELDAQLARYREYYENPVFDRVSKFLVRRVMASLFDEGS